MILISISYQIILVIGDSLFFGGFEIGEEVLVVYGEEAKFVECRSDDDFIWYARHEC